MRSIALTCFLVTVVAAADDATSLKSYNVDIKETSVSGLSSGAFFAVQMQVAFSSIIKGAGIVAGGPFDCGAEHLVAFCMTMASPLGTSGITKTKSWSGSKIDDTANMKHQKVYLISGTLDIVVSQSVMNQLYEYYVTEGHFVDEANVMYNKKLSSGHTFPTDFDSQGNSRCASSSSPFISNCGFDGAGAILQHIYPDMKNRTQSPTGHFIKFKQTEFGNAHSIGLDDYGYVYVPKTCADGAKCRLHIAFHGCVQSYSNVGTKFLANTGYDKWADNNHLIVLFPQTRVDFSIHLTPANSFLNNMNACWDWMGMYDTAFATKDGLQMATIKHMIDRITGHSKAATA